MALYGDVDTVKAFLRADADHDLDADADIRLGSIQVAVSAALEGKIGRTFGDGPVSDETVLVWAADSDVLILPKPARSITSVTVDGSVAGGVFSGGSILTDANWVHWSVDEDGLIYGLRGYGWYGAVQVVGQFVDNDDDAGVPDDITETANYLMAEEYKIRQASPAGFVGPDGATVPIRNPWNAPMVQAVIAKYAIGGPLLVV